MKKIMILFMVSLLTIGSGMAQANMNPEEVREKVFNAKMKTIQERLNLTEDQMVKFAPVYKKYMESISAIKHPDKKQKGEVKTRIDAEKVLIQQLDFKSNILNVQRSYVAKFADVLTPEQLVRLPRVESEVQRSIMREHMKRGGKHGRGDKQCGQCDKRQMKRQMVE